MKPRPTNTSAFGDVVDGVAHRLRARLLRGKRSAGGLSALTTAQSSRLLVREDARLGGARTPPRPDGDRDGRARNSAARQSTDGTCRSPRAGSCWPRPRARVSGVDSSTCALSGTPMLPPTSTRRPAASQHPAHQRRRRRLALGAGDRDDAARAASATRARARQSPARRARARATPRAAQAARPDSSRSRSARVERRRAMAAELERRRRPPAARALPESPASRSVSVTRAPRRASSRAAATPLRAAPTTSTAARSRENDHGSVIAASTSSG